MTRIPRRCRNIISSLALAVPVFALACVVTPAPDGSFGTSIAEAKGKGGKSSAKGRSGDQKLAKKERAGGSRKVKADRERGRGDKVQDRSRERQEREARRENRDRDARQDDSAGYRDHQQDHDVASSTQDYELAEPRNLGATSSQLKHRNAARASERAFQNAAPNSNVGRISTYRDAARATLDKERDIDLLDRDIAELQRERELAIADGRFAYADAVETDILRLEDERYLAEDDLHNLLLVEQDAYGAVGGPELDEHDYRVFRSMLGLD